MNAYSENFWTDCQDIIRIAQKTVMMASVGGTNMVMEHKWRVYSGDLCNIIPDLTVASENN